MYTEVKEPVEKEYCLKCHQPNPPERAVCECGGRNFIFGKHFTYENGNVTCECGNDEFHLTAHFALKTFHNHTKGCTKCKRAIGLQYYINDENADA